MGRGGRGGRGGGTCQAGGVPSAMTGAEPASCSHAPCRPARPGTHQQERAVLGACGDEAGAGPRQHGVRPQLGARRLGGRGRPALHMARESGGQGAWGMDQEQAGPARRGTGRQAARGRPATAGRASAAAAASAHRGRAGVRRGVGLLRQRRDLQAHGVRRHQLRLGRVLQRGHGGGSLAVGWGTLGAGLPAAAGFGSAAALRGATAGGGGASGQGKSRSGRAPAGVLRSAGLGRPAHSCAAPAMRGAGRAGAAGASCQRQPPTKCPVPGCGVWRRLCRPFHTARLQLRPLPSVWMGQKRRVHSELCHATVPGERGPVRRRARTRCSPPAGSGTPRH